MLLTAYLPLSPFFCPPLSAQCATTHSNRDSETTRQRDDHGHPERQACPRHSASASIFFWPSLLLSSVASPLTATRARSLGATAPSWSPPQVRSACCRPSFSGAFVYFFACAKELSSLTPCRKFRTCEKIIIVKNPAHAKFALIRQPVFFANAKILHLENFADAKKNFACFNFFAHAKKPISSMNYFRICET